MGKIGNFDTDAQALVKRLAAHDKFGEHDFNGWCFETLGVQAGQRVLDLGCGTGKQSLALAKLGCEVVSVDASADALGILGKAAQADCLQTIKTVQSLLDDVPGLKLGTFDRAISAYAIYYTQDADALFKHIRNSLPDGGAFLFCGPAYDNNMEMKSFLTAIGQTFTPGAAPFMEETGPEIAHRHFGSVTLSKFENPVTFKTPEAMWEYWSSHNMFDPSVETKFKAQAQDHFQAHGSFTMTKRVRGVLATR